MYRNMHSVDSVTAAARAASLRSLLRHVRAARRGRASSLADPPLLAPFAGWAALGLGELCDELLRHTAVLEAADRDLLCRYYGLAGPPVALAEAATGMVSARGVPLGTRQLHNRLNRAVDAMADRMPAKAPVDADGAPPRLEPPRWPGLSELRSRLADRHYAAQLRRVLAAAGQASSRTETAPGGRTRVPVATALAQLAADAFGDPQPADDDGEPIPPWLRWRLRALAWTTAVAACPMLAERPPDAAPRRSAVEADAAAGSEPLVRAPAPAASALTGAPDPEAVAAMLDAAQQALQAVDGLTARSWLTLAEQTLAGTDPADEGWRARRAHLLQLWVAAESHIGSLRTFDRFRDLERLAGPGAYICLAAFDVSFMLSAFGHVDEALTLLHAQRTRLVALPPAQAPFFQNWLRVRAAIVLQKRAAMNASLGDLLIARRIVARTVDEGGLPEFELHEMDRTTATIDLSMGELAVAERRRGADEAFDRAAGALRRRPPSVGAYDPVRGSIPGTYRTDVRWAMAAMASALHTDDAGAFSSAALVGLRHWNALPNAPIVGLAMRRLIGRGGERFQLDIPVMAPPAPFTGWHAGFQPSARILTLVGGRSWVCPSWQSWR